MNIDDAEKYFIARIEELRRMCSDGTPWVFVCAATMIDYLSKLTNGADKGGDGYKAFIRDYMAQVRPEYAMFIYDDGNQDLPVQIYHIFRCGIVHSFSFIPDQRASAKDGRKRSIVLSHKREGLGHISKYSSANAPDSCNFVAEDFIDDLAKTIHTVFAKAKADNNLKDKIELWLTRYPPIMGNI
ncbi:MAG: hypothetical protein HZB33_01845 [Nitrospirae bacterium]|nr:hypothetical protein [Nitrospirota bacterium]